MTRLVICSKSAWEPAIRREHELARIAAAAGLDVVFIERPEDIRALASNGRRAWIDGLRMPRVRREGAVQVVSRSTLAPGHRGALPGRIDASLLESVLTGLAGQTVVAMVPWEWPAVARCRSAQRVFDCADDWSQLLPKRRAQVLALYRRIGAEADTIVCASEQLAGLFPGRQAAVVPNGTPASLLAEAPTAPPGTSTMVYAGTLSERFDAPFIDAVLKTVPEWRLDLYGPCQYVGRRSGLGPELANLLARWPGRTTWHGSVDREQLAGRLDTGDVLVIPHRRRGAVGGDAMKFYDYAARGRPVATTPWTSGIESMTPPHTHVAATPEAFATAVLDATHEPEEFVSARRRWAESNAWEARWNAWAEAVSP